MTRVAVGLEYDGTAYSGWQHQPHARTVQGELERAFARVAAHPVELTAAGRTDAGVHALGQVAHFDTSAVRTERAWVLGANSEARQDVRVLWACAVASDFHARHSALSRTYRYLILDAPIRPSLDRHRVCWSRRPLDADAMHRAAQVFAGEHDFAAFRAAECQSRSTVRRVLAIEVAREGALVALTVRANAFLHHMVRNIAGALLAVGTGDRDLEWVRAALDSRDRTRAGVTAPPQGLYLTSVEYPMECGLAAAGGRGRGTPWLAATARV
jgi:tRNA pseudouridine38-40 synthase